MSFWADEGMDWAETIDGAKKIIVKKVIFLVKIITTKITILLGKLNVNLHEEFCFFFAFCSVFACS